jgi:hypothetical protein
VKSPLSYAAVALFVAGGSAITAAPGQVSRPGEPTKAEVWVQNRKSEPIPVSLHEVDVEAPIRVTVWNGEPSSHAPNPVSVRVTRAVWDYQTARVTSESAARLLNALGAQGWEATGIAWPEADGITTLLLTRPR